MVKDNKKELLRLFKPNVDAILADKGYVSEEVASWGLLKALPKLRKGQQALNERDSVTMKHLVDIRAIIEHLFKELKTTFPIFSRVYGSTLDECNTMFRLACAILNIRNHPNQNATLCPVTIPLTDSTTDDRDPFCCSEVGSDEEDNPSVLEEFVRDLTARTKSASFKRLEKEMLEDEESSDTEVPLNPRDPDYEGMDQDLIPTFNDEPEREQRPGLGFEPLEEEEETSEIGRAHV